MVDLVEVDVSHELDWYVREMLALSRGLARDIASKRLPMTVSALVPLGTDRRRVMQVKVGGLLGKTDTVRYLEQYLTQVYASATENVVVIFELLLAEASDLEWITCHADKFVTKDNTLYCVLFLDECNFDALENAFLSTIGDHLFIAVAKFSDAFSDRSLVVTRAPEHCDRIFLSAYDGEGLLVMARAS
jgi:hypothetical protein